MWTEENIKLAVDMWNAGEKTKLIADMVGVNTMAVVNKMQKVRIDGTHHVIKPKPKKDRQVTVLQNNVVNFTRSYQKTSFLKKKKGVKVSKETGYKYEDLKRGMCFYPLGDIDEKPSAWCGEKTKGTYCECHERVAKAYVPARTNRKFNYYMERIEDLG